MKGVAVKMLKEGGIHRPSSHSCSMAHSAGPEGRPILFSSLEGYALKTRLPAAGGIPTPCSVVGGVLPLVNPRASALHS